EQLFQAMMACMRGADPERIRARWLELDRALEQHLSAEEELILPRFEREFPASAARLRQEHREIRAALVELGVDLDLHSLGPSSARRFIDALRSHAAYEDAVLYAWVQRNLPEEDKLSLLDRLRRVSQMRTVRPLLEETQER
ncbi:MAG TPA: hemerythrin domain-containing protein, partial [Polyangiales bacterium]